MKEKQKCRFSRLWLLPCDTVSWCRLALICHVIVAKAILWSRETIFSKLYPPQHPPIFIWIRCGKVITFLICKIAPLKSSSLCLKVSNPGPFVTTNFQLIGHYSDINQDIFLKFWAFVHHMSTLNWQKNFCHRSIWLLATADISQNLERL